MTAITRKRTLRKDAVKNVKKTDGSEISVSKLEGKTIKSPKKVKNLKENPKKAEKSIESAKKIQKVQKPKIKHKNKEEIKLEPKPKGETKKIPKKKLNLKRNDKGQIDLSLVKLSDAIETEDPNLLNTFLMIKDQNTCKEIVETLGSEFVLHFLSILKKKLISCKSPKFSLLLLGWIKSTISAHLSLLNSNSECLKEIFELNKLLKTKFTAFDSLLQLNEKLNVVLEQVEKKKELVEESEKGTAKFTLGDEGLKEVVNSDLK